MIARLIIGGIALAATGYGLKKYVQDNDKENVLSDATLDVFEWGDNLGRKIGEFGDRLVYGDEKKDNTPKDVIEEFNIIHNGFYEEMIPYFLDVYGSLKNLPDLDMDSFYKLESKTETNVLDINEQEKAELDKYVVKLSKGICAIWMELKEIRLLQKENHDFSRFSKSTKRKIEDTHALMAKLIKVYNLKVINDKGKLEEEYKKALDSIELVADKII